MKMIVTIIPTDIVTNLLLSSFCPFLQTKKPVRIIVAWYAEKRSDPRWTCDVHFLTTIWF